jgi:hypothetical protein
MTACAMGMLSPANRPPAPWCSRARLQRAEDRLKLPIRHDGLGHLSAARRAAAAFIASVVSSAVDDELLRDHIDGLSRFADYGQEVLELELANDAKTVRLLPDHQHALLDISFYEGLFIDSPDLKMQKDLAEGIHRVQAARVARQETASGQGGVTDSDMVAALAHGRPTRIYVAPLSKKKHRMVPERFIAYTRFVLRIPQLQKLDNARAESGLDYHVESCIGAHTKEVKGEPDSEQVRAARLMDLNGNHANSNCLTTMAGRAHIHNELVNAVYDAALEAGVKAQPRPQTHVMLLNQFTAEECRTLFPRQARKGYQARA